MDLLLLMFTIIFPGALCSMCCHGLKYNFFPVVLPLKKAVVQSRTVNNQSAYLAIDGDVYTCSFTGDLRMKFSWWRVELDGIFEVTNIVLNFIPGTPYSRFMNNLKIYISLDNEDYEQNLCTSYGRMDSILHESPLNLYCQTPISGKFLTIRRDGAYWAGHLSLCEVNIYGGGQTASLSLHKPTTQNGILFLESSDLAVDGDVKTCTKVQAKKYQIAWWRVTLEDIYYISNVTIFYDPNLSDSLTLNNFEIYVSTNAEDLHQQLCAVFYDFKDNFHNGSLSLSCGNVQSGRFITIQKFGGRKRETLFFCEVLVWGSEYKFSNVCLSEELVCLEDGVCIPKFKICDGIRDCSSNIDEANCACSEFQYRCREAQCIHKDWLCDGTADCPKGDDEEVNSCVTCDSTKFKCYKNNVCIDLALRCNGFIDCSDSSDEIGCLELQNSFVRQNIPRFLIATFRGQKNFYVCADNWVPLDSLYACLELGKTIDKETSLVSLSTTKFLRKKSSVNYQNGKFYMTVFDKSSYCTTQKFVQITCAEISDSDCGVRAFPDNVLGPYIINGERAKVGAWPWHVQIFNLVSPTICGGSLIRNNWVLTAAHCLEDVTSVSQIKFKYGSIISDDRSTHINSAVRFIVHPNYKKFGFPYDIALIQLKFVIAFDKVKRPICLPRERLKDVELRSFKYCVFSGFGNINRSKWKTNYLMQGRMNLMTNEECISNLKVVGRDPEKVYRDLFADNSTICTGSHPANTGTTPCSQDSGNPLVCKDEHGIWTQVGIITSTLKDVNGKICGNAVITRVDHYLSFIELSIEDV